MKCTACGAALAAGAIFCSSCGAKQPAACAGCGHALAPEARFCAHCGAPVVAAGAAAPAPAAAASPPAGPSGETAAPRREAGEAQRRQLTVLFCDLVGSTALSSELDPEDLRDLMKEYQDACASPIAHYDGFIAQTMGDGLMVYFGWPHGHEDAPARAVRAGLGILEAIAGLNLKRAERGGGPIHVRIGAQTGLVVLGDVSAADTRGERAVVGDTPNLASRLQGLAQPGTFVIGPGTSHLVAGQFECDDLGEHQLKGFSQPIRAHRVRGAVVMDTRFAARVRGQVAPMVGRTGDLERLLSCWESARRRQGRVAVVFGEAGIGKSRLTVALADSLGQPTEAARLRYQCSPYDQNRAFYPVIQQLERATGFGASDTDDVKLDKLLALLADAGADAFGNLQETAALLAALLGIPAGKRLPPLLMSPMRQKQKTIEALTNWMLALSNRAPVLILLEDAHWIDPSTLELLDLTISRLPDRPVFCVLTSRPEFAPPTHWEQLGYVAHLKLGRLDREAGAQIVHRAARGKCVPSQVLDQILAKTDGVPLFIEELTNHVLESGLLVEETEAWRLAKPLGQVEIPATLQASLSARLDRLGHAKEVAQLGATIGRQFTHELLAAVSPLPAAELERHLDRLVESQLLQRTGLDGADAFLFKHALVQDAAYESMLKKKRQQLHERIARTLEEKFPRTAETQPDLLAQHYAAARLPEKAVPRWQAAAYRAMQQSAFAESGNHLNRGLEQVRTLPPGHAQRDAWEFELAGTLGQVYVMSRGYANPDVETAYLRAIELGRKLNDVPKLFAYMWGLWTFYLVRGDIAETYRFACETVKVVEGTDDVDLLVPAHMVMVVTYFYLGEFRKADEALRKLRAGYDPERHKGLVWKYNHDPLATALIYAVHFHWMLGSPDQAVRDDDEKNAICKRLGHPFQTVFALTMGASCHIYRRDVDAHLARVQQGLAIAQELNFPFYVGHGTLHRGLAMVMSGKVEEGLATLQEGLKGWAATGAGLLRMWYCSMMALALRALGRIDEAIAELDTALALIERSSERCHEADIRRLRGELLLEKHPADPAAGEAELLRALEVARRQEARGWELRIVTSLARHYRARGQAAHGRELLEPVYRGFTEGLNTPDLVDARAVLDSLGA